MNEHPEPWHVAWLCGCDDAQPTRSELPERCPGHDAELVDPPHILWRMVAPGLLARGERLMIEGARNVSLVECGHQCDPSNPCPEGRS